MPSSDILLVIQWWSALFLVGVAAFPLTKRLFGPPAVRLSSPSKPGGWPAIRSPDEQDEGWYDKGYFFSKAVGMAVVSYIIYVLGTLHVAPFTLPTIFGVIGALFLFGIILSYKTYTTHKTNTKLIFCVVIEEVIFFGILLFWSWVKAHEPSIRGLEKFMDYGFMQSILNSSYFPAPDMWWQGGNINYYYFGHLVTAVLTRLSGLDLSVTFNLMLATICALTATMSFSIGYQLMYYCHSCESRNLENKGWIPGQARNDKKRTAVFPCFISGLLTAFLVTFAGNMQTLYAFTKGYTGDNVEAFWKLLWLPSEFVTKVGEGIQRYWYANATRFIPFTIHEFPSYSFVVSDVHGHVLSIPFVLLSIALLIIVGLRIADYTKNTNQSVIRYAPLFNYVFYGFLLGILLMTNALDGPIYGLLFATLIAVSYELRVTSYEFWKKFIIPVSIVGFIALFTALPFLIHFKSFATGIGVNCPPAFLANSKIGPFIFEGVEKCQKSPLWMMELLWGFFWYTGVFLFVKSVWPKKENEGWVQNLLKIFFVYGIFLIIIPEFLYAKDIYPAHFRSNTMFKLGYQAFILWSIVAGYVIVHFIFHRNIISQEKNSQFSILNSQIKFNVQFSDKTIRILFFLFLIPQLFLVSIFPIFSVRSYFGELRTYRGIYGLEWLEKEYPDDWNVIEWMKNELREKQGSPSTTLRATMTGLPVIVEADGESYTDYNHVSAFTGIPTIVGWGVHEWLWRGTYDVVAPRREEVKTIYESRDIEETREILEKYNVRYILVGKLEREKYKALYEEKFWSYGPPVFRSGNTVLWEVK